MTIPNPLSSFKNWCIFLLLGGCIVLWLTRGCNRPSPAITQNTTVNDTVKQITAKAQAAEERAGYLLEDSIQLSQALQGARDSLKQSTKLIHAANNQNTALANEVADAHIALDTLRFIRGCDSLALVTKQYQDKFNIFERDNNNALKACKALNDNKSATIKEWITAANGYKRAVNLLKKQDSTLFKMVDDLLTPKRKVYIGLEAWTCPAASGVGPGIMYEDKRERIYRIGAGLVTTGNYWIGGSAYIKLQFHK